ncbi:hypothetical protein [Donghicola mangrovi]|uniref:Uncharacterized protein n=1 Tax=Donghicola mangrovi TaxID=2729614 RepID=A0A850QGP8_9RHOB|nr:hypothetical protein [Donghicola mangrovi]NVO25545.1 hypothetical protein [Donghicola mangrovi]
MLHDVKMSDINVYASTEEISMLKKVLRWGFVLLALIAVGGYLFLFPPLPRPPELGRGLPNNFAAADEEFGRRVLAAFPAPLTVEALISRLREQGFTVNEEAKYAIFEKNQFPCTLMWRIDWTAEGDSVENLTSKYGGACL